MTTPEPPASLFTLDTFTAQRDRRPGWALLTTWTFVHYTPLVRWVLLMLLSLLLACGGGVTAEQREHSMREFDYANSLHEEGNVAGALEHLQNAINLDEQNARAHLLLGVIHARTRRDYVNAEASTRRALEILESEDNEDQPALRAEAYNLLGLILMGQERHAEAVAPFETSANDMLNRAQHLALGNLGWAYNELERYPEAIATLERAVQIQPRFCVGYYRMGQAQFALEDLEAAEQSLNRAIEADEACAQSFQDAYKLRGEVRARLGHHEEAVADLERCVELGEQTDAGSACQTILSSSH